MSEQREKVEEITRRHIRRILSRLEEIGISIIAKEAIKREFWQMNDDCAELLEFSVLPSEKEQTEDEEDHETTRI